jgi:sarcosine oxidase subunit beta
MNLINSTFDVIVIGAGSIGTPVGMFLAKEGLKTLIVESAPSVGQASNKHAIGGIRATHSDPSKIYLCQRSLDHFSHWKQNYGDDIEWFKGGYSFIAYAEKEKRTLIDLLSIQKSFNLNIDWYDRDDLLRIIPDLKSGDLLGGTYSPDDGSASPLRAAYAFYKAAIKYGADFRFNEQVIRINQIHDQISGVETNLGNYNSKYVINAGGSWANNISSLANLPLPIYPDSHEAGITEPVQHMFDPMVVDIRPGPGSSNFYFYQHPTGKIIFCLTPNPQIWGNLNTETSDFLIQASRRLIEVMPRLSNIRVRRTWRGTYPMTPDGSPIVGKVDSLKGYILASGMCGQGFMLGPGVGELISHLVLDNLNKVEQNVLKSLSLNRDFSSMEKLK